MTEKPAESGRCVTCGGPIVDSPVGWTHVDVRGALIGWLCPHPHMTLAVPEDPNLNGSRRRTAIPPSSRNSSSYPGL